MLIGPGQPSFNGLKCELREGKKVNILMHKVLQEEDSMQLVRKG